MDGNPTKELLCIHEPLKNMPIIHAAMLLTGPLQANSQNSRQRRMNFHVESVAQQKISQQT